MGGCLGRSRAAAGLVESNQCQDLLAIPRPAGGHLRRDQGLRSQLHDWRAPAKNILGERLGTVAGVAADESGKIVKVSIADGSGPVPLPWSFIEVRQEKESYPTEYDVEPVVVIDRP